MKAFDLGGKVRQLVHREQRIGYGSRNPESPAAPAAGASGNPAGKLTEAASDRPRVPHFQQLAQELQNMVIEQLDAPAVAAYALTNRKGYNDVRDLAPTAFKSIVDLQRRLQSYFKDGDVSVESDAGQKILDIVSSTYQVIHYPVQFGAGGSWKWPPLAPRYDPLRCEVQLHPPPGDEGEGYAIIKGPAFDPELHTFKGLLQMSDSMVDKVYKNQHTRLLEVQVGWGEPLESFGRVAGALLGSGKLKRRQSKALARAVRNAHCNGINPDRVLYRSNVMAHAFTQIGTFEKAGSKAAGYLVSALHWKGLPGRRLKMPRDVIGEAGLPAPVLRMIEKDIKKD